MTEAGDRYLAQPVERIDIDGTVVPVRRFGSGPPLLLVHGFPLSGFTWRFVIPELARHYTCLAVDLPGLGDSGWTDATDFSFPGQGRTLHRVADALGLDEYRVLAQDTGGTFARFLALERSSRHAPRAREHRDPGPPTALGALLSTPHAAARVAGAARAARPVTTVRPVVDGLRWLLRRSRTGSTASSTRSSSRRSRRRRPAATASAGTSSVRNGLRSTSSASSTPGSASRSGSSGASRTRRSRSTRPVRCSDSSPTRTSSRSPAPGCSRTRNDPTPCSPRWSEFLRS